MFTKMQSGLRSHLLTVLLAGLFLLSACIPAVSATTPPTATSAPIAAVEPTAPVATAIPTQDGALYLSLDTGFQIETVAAVPASENAPYWEVLPEYTRLTLDGYPISLHLMQPQIFVYPVNDLGAVNEGAGEIAASLQTLLQLPQEIPNMPFLPLTNGLQAMHAQVQYLDFKTGQGVRFLTQHNTGIAPINNEQLVYTYQGMTSDGKYYVAAVLPVTHPELPATPQVEALSEAELNDYPAYLANTATWLNQQPSGSFTPDLTQLDALMRSLEIK